MTQCPETSGHLRCTHDAPHPGHSHDFWPDQELAERQEREEYYATLDAKRAYYYRRRDRLHEENRARMEEQAKVSFIYYVGIVSEALLPLVATDQLDDLESVAEAAVQALLDDGVVFSRIITEIENDG